MRRLILPLLLAASLALPGQAQDAPDTHEDAPPAAPMLDFFDRMLRGFMTEIEPQMRDLERGLEALEPEIQGFIDRMRSMAQYHPPEILPNGDILIRRRTEDEAPPEPDPDRSESIPFEL